MFFSKRSHPTYETNRISEVLARKREAGERINDLTLSNPLDAALEYDKQGVDAALSASHRWQYQPNPLGLLRAREAISETLQAEGLVVPPDQIVITSSTSEAYSFLFKLLCEPTDGVAIPAPSYPLFDHLAGLENVQLRPYSLRYDGEWFVDRTGLRNACGPDTKAVVVVNPNNPTGSYLHVSDCEALHSLKLPIISDEVFWRYPLHEGAAPPRMNNSDGLTFHLDGLSKRAALPHLKFAWIAVEGSPELVRQSMQRLEWIADAFLSPNALVQHALPELLATSGVVQQSILRRTRSNLQALTQACQASPCTVLRVQGGWYGVLEVPSFLDEESWVLRLLEQANVYVHPGYFYDFASGTHLVLSLLPEPTNFEYAIKKTLEVVARS